MRSRVQCVVAVASLCILMASSDARAGLPVSSSNCDGDAGCWVILSVPQYAQENTLWCHAAAAQSIVNAYSAARTQCTCYQSNTGASCSTNQISYVSNVENTIWTLSGADGIIVNDYMSWSTTWDQLYNRHIPMVARVLKNNGSYGHFIVIKGVDDDASADWVRVWDPEFGGSASWVDFSTLVSAGGTYQWTHSIYNFQ
ncbi:papain-like cysteine protease family protein [Archangium sp.]|uniref:papain-like cysteine protease family protein n=1 Tax=Archangium sp. TaxID=1872627 RepID=UPI002D544A84|nr:papain-like cysteine protease family protein [Archangium sp.]HYO56377.1 papain-like cysteine protease family protein [Archangium sp.]